MRTGLITLALTLAAGPVSARPPEPARVQVAASTLGDLSPFRKITADTLAMVQKGDLPAARLRIKDLETSWDKAESTLKPKDKATWTTLDGKIDEALTDIRIANSKADACEASLKALLASFDAAERA